MGLSNEACFWQSFSGIVATLFPAHKQNGTIKNTDKTNTRKGRLHTPGPITSLQDTIGITEYIFGKLKWHSKTQSLWCNHESVAGFQWYRLPQPDHQDSHSGQTGSRRRKIGKLLRSADLHAVTQPAHHRQVQTHLYWPPTVNIRSLYIILPTFSPVS